jgi:hypothetical protein
MTSQPYVVCPTSHFTPVIAPLPFDLWGKNTVDYASAWSLW